MKYKRFVFDIALLSAFVSLTVTASMRQATQVASATASQIVISEIKKGGESARDEFVELYNPTGQSISLEGWRLTRKTAAGTSESNLVASMSGSIVPGGYFLITHPENTSIQADLVYSAASQSVTDNNTILLYSDAGDTLVDKVGMGEATDSETSPAANPADGQSIERKANTSSTVESMTNGDDINTGNGEDTDNNSSDFILRTTAQPQNTQSTPEASGDDPIQSPSPSPVTSPEPTPAATPNPTPTPEASPTPTPVPTPTLQPSPTPQVTPSPEPTPMATPTPSPTEVPSPSPTPVPTPSPTPTLVPSPSPTPVPTPSPEPSPTVVPTPTPVPTPTLLPTPEPTIEPWPDYFSRTLVCGFQPKSISGRYFRITYMVFSCSWH